MQLSAEQLEATSPRPRAGGVRDPRDEPMLAARSRRRDARAAAAALTERQVLEPGRGLRWSEFAHATQGNCRVRGERGPRARLHSGSRARRAAKAIAAYCAQPAAEHCFLLVSVQAWTQRERARPGSEALGRRGVRRNLAGSSAPGAGVASREARTPAPKRVRPRCSSSSPTASRGNLLAAAHPGGEEASLVAGEGALTRGVQEAVSTSRDTTQNDSGRGAASGRPRAPTARQRRAWRA